MTKKLVEKVGFEGRSNDDLITKIIRNDIVKLVCSLDYGECIKKMEENFSSWLQNSDTQYV